MVSAVKRRSSSSTRAKQLISAIVYVRQQKQIPNLKRISSYMVREHDVAETETQKQLNLAVKDGLINSYTAVGSKGAKTGIEQEGFKIPLIEDTELDDGHDWYCFECHKSGEILECAECWRVFHKDCADNETDGSSFVCYICQSGKTKNQLKRKMLNTLLSYTVMRLKEKTRELHKIGFREENHDLIFDRFIYKTMDLNMMEQKVSRHKYKCLEQFQADAQTILHAVHILYGDEKGGITELSRIMVHDCKYDIEEIRQCHRCYYLSNAKPQHWFCQPCDPPHELVFAKQKGYSYWPAKIIRNYGDKCDVRFFGAFHQRAVIPMEYIRPVTTNIKTLNIKKTTGFNNSMKELHIHQKLVEEIATDQKEKEEEEESEKEEESSASEEEGVEDPVEAVEEEEPMEVEEETDKQVTSTSVQPPRKKRKYSKKAASPESSLVVTSSEDQVAATPPVAISTTACQTVKLKVHSVHVQTDEVKEEKENEEIIANCKEGCNCKENKQALEDLRKTLLKEHSSEKEEALKELTEKLLKSFEEDKQQAVSRTMANTKTEIERIRKQTEEKCKEKFMEEMKKLAAKHKEAISQTKKKQWCFNCEEEAMYHCCWNTSYCSVKCQQEHWHKDHKRICRRKR